MTYQLSTEKYQCLEFSSYMTAFLVLVMLIFQTSWKISSVTITIPLVAEMILVHNKYGDQVPREFFFHKIFLNVFLCSAFYFFESEERIKFAKKNKLKDAYESNKTILECIPHMVFICKFNKNQEVEILFENSSYSNQKAGLQQVKLEGLNELDSENEEQYDFNTFLSNQMKIKEEDGKMTLIGCKISQNGVFNHFSFSIQKIKWFGTHMNFLIVLYNIQTLHELKSERERLKFQKLMFSSASHEFRTPLNIIINSVNVLDQTLQHTTPENLDQSREKF